MAHRYVESGYCCAIHDAVFPEWPVVGHGRWEAALSPVQHKLVVWLPSFQRIIERNRSRTGRARLKESTLKTIYDQMLPWRDDDDAIIVDNSDLTIEETARLLDPHLAAPG